MARPIVWILGAGFSKPLGGPLLTELFGPRMYEGLKARLGAPGVALPDHYPLLSGAKGQYARLAHQLYRVGLDDSEL